MCLSLSSDRDMTGTSYTSFIESGKSRAQRALRAYVPLECLILLLACPHFWRAFIFVVPSFLACLHF